MKCGHKVTIFYTPKSAFSLVELSIVLVILGLLVGGILSGQSLIRAAELRAVTTEYTRWVTATQTFRDKYFALPGDMTNATAFWGKDNANCPADTGAAAANGTCNGNGDGSITYSAAAAITGEAYQYWRQLASAGLIEGTYTGLAGAGSGFATTLGTNIPRSKLSDSGWDIWDLMTQTVVGGQWIPAVYGNSYFFGVQLNYTSGAALKPEEAWNIDTKLDDGLAGQGKVLSWSNTYQANCANADTTAAVYTLTYSSKACALIFKGGF